LSTTDGIKNNATPLILIRDAYEAIVLTAFFYLLLAYLSPDAEEQKLVFVKHGLSKENDEMMKRTGGKVQKWVWPFGWVKKKPKVLSASYAPPPRSSLYLQDGLYFLQLMKWGVLQYCVVRPVWVASISSLFVSDHSTALR